MFEILLAFSQNNDWKKSLCQVIPPRKVASTDIRGDEAENQVVLQQSMTDNKEVWCKDLATQN